ncbi:MAG: hypothetical protein ACO3LO_02675, partial [Ilumatobacteraceae bacterium]
NALQWVTIDSEATVASAVAAILDVGKWCRRVGCWSDAVRAAVAKSWCDGVACVAGSGLSGESVYDMGLA